jgi:hypothetical protein
VSHSLCCVLVSSSLFIQLCFGGVGQPAKVTMLVYTMGGWGNTTWCLVLTYLVCQMSPKQVWNQCLAAVVALLFSQCNVVWRSFVWAGGSGCWSFGFPWCFISAKCGSRVSARFLIHGVHAFCFCTLVAILDLLPWFWLKFMKSLFSFSIFLN